MRLPMLALVGRSVRRSRWLLLSLGGVLGLFQVLMVLAASYLREQQSFSQVVALLPMLAQQFLGGVFSSFAALVAFGYFHPLVIVAFAGLAIVMASEPAGDVESGIVDLLLARPVRRVQLVTRSALMTAMTTTGIALVMLGTSGVSLAAIRDVGPLAPILRTLAKVALNLVAVTWCVGSFALAMSTLVSRRATAAGTAGIVALAFYLLNALADLSSTFRRFGPYSPFHYFQPTAIIAGGNRWHTDVALLLGATAILTLVAYVAWARRDL